MGSTSGTVFVSYRRAETGDAAARLGYRLGTRFGAHRVVSDVSVMQPGQDFADAIGAAVSRSLVMLVLIGPKWVSAHDTDDFDVVAVEVRSGLAAGLTVIPVLVGGASMPTVDELPRGLRPLAGLEAFRLSDEAFDDDIRRLVRSLTPVLAPEDAPPADPTGSQPEAAIQPGRSLRGVKLGRPEAAMHKLLGDPVVTQPGIGAVVKCFYPDLGLEARVDGRYVSALVAHAIDARDLTFRLLTEVRLPEGDWRPFDGATPEGISVASTRAQVEAAYGGGQPLTLPFGGAAIAYPKLGLTVIYQRWGGGANEFDAPVQQLWVLPPEA